MIETIEPNLVSSLVPNTITLRGRHLFLAAQIDLGDRDGTNVGDRFAVNVGGTSMPEVTFINTETVTFALPKNTPAGSYNIELITPQGHTVLAPAMLQVVEDPIGLPLFIEDAPGGDGAPIGAHTASAGSQLSAYAVVRDREGVFISDADVHWDVTGGIGEFDDPNAAPAHHGVLQLMHVGDGRITASHPTALPAQSGVLTVIAGSASKLDIVDAPGAQGQAVAATSISTDEAPTFYAIARDGYGNYVTDIEVDWSLSAAIGTLSTERGKHTVLDAQTPGSGVISATASGLGTASTGPLTVHPGRAATLTAIPDELVLSADAAPHTFTVLARDADDNPTTDTGTLTWTVASGPIGAFSNAQTGVFDPRQAGVGTVAVTSSHGPSDESGAIEITAGRAVAIAITPDSTTVSADAAPFAFAVVGSDADGNPTADVGTITWAVTQGPIGALGVDDGVLDPTIAGTGRITATSSYPGVADESGTIVIAPGVAAALDIVPDSAVVAQGDDPIAFSVAARDGDNNPTDLVGTLTWFIDSGPIDAIDAATGVFTPLTAGSGTIGVQSSHGPAVTDASGTITVHQAAVLAAAITLPESVTPGQSFAIALRVSNVGESDAAEVVPDELVFTGTSVGTARDSGPTPAIADIPAGSAVDFRWTYTAGSPGALTASGAAGGTDLATGNPITSDSAASTATVHTPADLSASIAVPDEIGLSTEFTVSMSVSNLGEADAVAVAPDTPLTSIGDGNITALSGPVPTSAAIVGGENTAFTWIYRADSAGVIGFRGGADGTEADTDRALRADAVDSNLTEVSTHALLASDPFADGTSFAFVFAYDDQIFLGPSADGSSIIRMQPNGSGAQSSGFSIPKDVDGNSHSHTLPGPFPSFGYTGCTRDTYECGPDNENGRGYFTAGVIASTEWIIAGSGNTAGNLDWFYMSPDTDYGDGTIDFRFIDGNDELHGATKGFSAAHVFADNVYVGFPNNSADTAPQLLRLAAVPPEPGFDPIRASEVFNLGAHQFMDDGEGDNIVDTITDFAGRIYVANAAGCFRSIDGSPTARNGSDFVECTPSDESYEDLDSRQTDKLADLEPADRAVPAFVSYHGQLYMARNTTAGPQLWTCLPARSGVANACDPDDWDLIVTNQILSSRRSQFDNADNVAISFLVATSSALYLGFDNQADGIVIFKSTAQNPTTAADFVGEAGCSADEHPTLCAGLGGNGLGLPPPDAGANSRIFSAAATNFSGVESVHLVTGNGAIGIRLYRLF